MGGGGGGWGGCKMRPQVQRVFKSPGKRGLRPFRIYIEARQIAYESKGIDE